MQGCMTEVKANAGSAMSTINPDVYPMANNMAKAHVPRIAVPANTKEKELGSGEPPKQF